jgi:hypothetical protein
MRESSKKVGLILAFMLIMPCFSALNTDVVFSSGVDCCIDVFTQKEPFSGKGRNVRSDAFGIGEIVVLYALVTYDELPMLDSLVSFYVRVPDNTSFILTATTNTSGVATANFTIPSKCANLTDVFGDWLVLANVQTGEIVVEDTLTFKVDWIVKLLSVRTVDANVTSRTVFGIGGDVGVEITLRNIALTFKNATFAVLIQDELQVIVGSTGMVDLEIQPNEKLIYLYCKLSIPKWAFPGYAQVKVSALTAPVERNGVPYCPSVNADFFISMFNPQVIALHDVAAVKIVPSATSVIEGDVVQIKTLVRNEATESESFQVNTYYNNTLIGTQQVSILAPYFSKSLDFVFNTSGLDSGDYTITVTVPYLAKEADLTDNTLVYESIEVKPKAPPVVHDIAIVNVTISETTLYIGDVLHINVTAVNKGTESESFDVKTYYGAAVIESLHVEALEPSEKITLFSLWNTSDVEEGYYRISALAPLAEDANSADNAFIDGVVQVKAKPPPPPTLYHDIAVLNVTPSVESVYIGDVVEVRVVVGNQGNFTETFDLTTFYNSSAIGILHIEDLQPDGQRQHVFFWNTQSVFEGKYVLSAHANPVSGEIEVANNLFVDGVVDIKVKPVPPPPEVHNVAVLNVVPSSYSIYRGDELDIDVTVKNRGNHVESFNVTLYYNSSVLGVYLVTDLGASAEKTIEVIWDTGKVVKGSYVLSAHAANVSGEVDISDNYYKDGTVKILEPPSGWYVPWWFYWLLPLLLILLIMLLILLLYSRKKRKKAQETFRKGWTAWYYGYDWGDKVPEV